MSVEPTSAPKRYSLFGLQIESDLELPELLPGSADLAPDVRIEVGDASVNGQLEPGLHRVGGDALLVVAETARYFVAGGCRIVDAAQHSIGDKRSVTTSYAKSCCRKTSP